MTPCGISLSLNVDPPSVPRTSAFDPKSCVCAAEYPAQQSNKVVAIIHRENEHFVEVLRLIRSCSCVQQDEKTPELGNRRAPCKSFKTRAFSMDHFWP